MVAGGPPTTKPDVVLRTIRSNHRQEIFAGTNWNSIMLRDLLPTCSQVNFSGFHFGELQRCSLSGFFLKWGYPQIIRIRPFEYWNLCRHLEIPSSVLCRTCTSAASTGKQHCLSFNVTFQEVGVHLPNPVSHTSKHPKIGVSSHQDQDPQVTVDFNTKIY